MPTFSGVFLDTASLPALSWCAVVSGLPRADPAVVCSVGSGDECGVQQGAAAEVPAPGRGCVQGPPCRGVEGR